MPLLVAIRYSVSPRRTVVVAPYLGVETRVPAARDKRCGPSWASRPPGREKMSDPTHAASSSLPPSPVPGPGFRRHGDAEDRGRRIRAQRLAILAIATGLAYLTWAWTAVDWSHPVVASAFVFAETCTLLLFAVAAAGSWRLRFKPAEAILQPLPEPVDVLIRQLAQTPCEIGVLARAQLLQERGALSGH